MAITKKIWEMVFHAIISVLLLFGLIRLMNGFGGDMLRLELLGFFVLLSMTVAGLIGFTKSCGSKLLFWSYLLYLINLLAIFWVTGVMSIILLVLSLIGFIAIIPNYGKKACCQANSGEQSNVPHSMVFEPEVKVSPVTEEKKAEAKKDVPKSQVKFIPGKYVASKSSNVYHEPKCDWAKKIRKERQVWFVSREDAWEKGYKKHICVKEE